MAHKKSCQFVEGHELILVCPEVLGGLPTPRESAEIVNGIVSHKGGTSVDAEFRRGAEMALNIVKDNQVDMVVLQSRSPSCGVNQIYDGSFTGKLIPGQGLFTALLKKNGIKVIDVEDLDDTPGQG